MTTPPPDHPPLSDSQLEAFLAGSLAPEEMARVTDLLRENPAAREQLERRRRAKSDSHHAETMDDVSSKHEQGTASQNSGSHGGSESGGSGDSSADRAAPQQPVSGVEEFTSLLSHSGLMSQEDVESFLQKSIPPDVTITSAGDLAQLLVRKHKLTEYQADWLRQGKTSGLVLGKYVILEKLGAGGMGVVFKAQHRRMKRKVALKVLPEALTRSPDALNRFHREVEAAAKLQHPNIASAYDADEDQGVHFLVMEYVDGPNLSAYLKQHGPLPLPYALALVLQTAHGLAHAHAQGVVHRDVKPGNLMVDAGGTLKILDMGLAQLQRETNDDGVDLTEITQSGRMMGTVDYMAPEQAVDAKTADERADIYSLACTFYHLAVGRTLAPEGSITQKLLWHQNETIPPLAAALPDAPESLGTVIARMLAKRPEDRQQTMEEVIADLENCLAELSAAEHLNQQTMSLQGPLSAVSLRPGQYRGGGDPSTVTSSKSPIKPVKLHLPKNPARMTSGGGKWYAAAALLGAICLLAVVAWQLAGRNTGPVAQDPPPPVPGPEDPAGSLPRTPPGDPPNLDPPPSDPVQVPATATAEQQRRRLLQWIFDNNGRVTLLTETGVAPQQAARLSELPEQGSFSIYGVHFDRSPVTDRELARLAELPGLQELSLAQTRLSDRGVGHLAELESLSLLDLSGTGLTDAGLATLARLDKLRELRLAKTGVSDAGMVYLTDLKQLERLDLTDTAVGDVGLRKLTEMDTLTQVALHGTRISEPGYRELAAALPRVELVWNGPDTERTVARELLEMGAILWIRQPGGEDSAPIERRADLPQRRFQVNEVDLRGRASFGDEDIRKLLPLSGLRQLSLEGTSVTDAGVLQLAELETLAVLDLGALPLSETTLQQLETRLPECRIEQQVTNERLTAEWVLSAGGTAAVATPEGELAGLRAVEQLPRGPFTLKSAILTGNEEVDDEALARFRGLAGLTSLHLEATAVTDSGLAHLIGCTALEELNLSHTAVSNAGLPAIVKLPSLRQLYLAGTQVSGGGLTELSRIPKLTHLSLARTALEGGDLVPLKGIRQLKWLSLSGTPIDDAALAHLSLLDELEDLLVEETNLSDAAVEELSAALSRTRLAADPPDPQRLVARWVLQAGGTVQAEQREIARLTDLPRNGLVLTAIDLADLERIDAEQLASLRACSQLQRLDLSRTSVSDADLENLAGLEQLRELLLPGTRVTDAGLAGLARLRQLETLDLSETRTTGAGLVPLENLPRLQVLRLARCRVADAGLEPIGRYTSLIELGLAHNTGITDEGVAKLEGLTALRVLDLSGTRIGDPSLSRLARFSELRQLNLSATQITDAAAGPLGGLAELQVLLASGTQIGDGTLAALARLQNIRTVEARRTAVTQAGADALRAAHPNARVEFTPRVETDPNESGGRFGG